MSTMKSELDAATKAKEIIVEEKNEIEHELQGVFVRSHYW